MFSELVFKKAVANMTAFCMQTYLLLLLIISYAETVRLLHIISDNYNYVLSVYFHWQIAKIFNDGNYGSTG